MLSLPLPLGRQRAGRCPGPLPRRGPAWDARTRRDWRSAPPRPSA